VLLSLVIVYLFVTIGIGLWAARRVKNTADFAIAGRHLPLYMIITTTFATWFGSELVLGVPAKFIEGGLHALVEDPFGAGMCLILVGLFFAAKLYRMNLLTISDYYRSRYGRAIEVVCSLIIMLSYLGWVSAQVTALGLVFNLLGRCRQHSHGHDDRRALRAGLHAVRRHVVRGRDGFRADDHSGRRPADTGLLCR
jgi:Na+/proline symporter